jgi:hypothetical protein
MSGVQQPREAESMPRFNHVAMSVSADLLDERHRGDILKFYGEVFGWTEMPTMTRDGERLVLRCHSNEQFVYLVHADDEQPMRCPKGDHFGMSVATPRALDDIMDRALKYAESDPRVEVSERQTDDFKVLQLHAVYIRYLLPLQIEVQCYDWADGFDAQSLG